MDSWADELPDDRQEALLFMASSSGWNTPVTMLHWLKTVFHPRTISHHLAPR